MDSIVFKIIIRRFFELLLTSAVISAIVTTLNIVDLLDTKNSLLGGMLIGTAFFVFVNVLMLRRCYFDLRNKLLYYFINLSAYLFFVIICFSVYVFCSNEFFTWIFAITKFARYTNAELPTLYSASVFHIIGLTMILFAPAGMSWIFVYDYDNDD